MRIMLYLVGVVFHPDTAPDSDPAPSKHGGEKPRVLWRGSRWLKDIKLSPTPWPLGGDDGLPHGKYFSLPPRVWNCPPCASGVFKWEFMLISMFCISVCLLSVVQCCVQMVLTPFLSLK